jgi:hypothetical protein
MTRRVKTPLVIVTAAIGLLGQGRLRSENQESPRRAPVTFSQVAQVFPPNCEFCHGWDEAKRGFFMGTYDGLLVGAFREGAFRREIIPGMPSIVG